MNEGYAVTRLSAEEEATLQRTFEDLMALTQCKVPSVRAAARAAVAHVAQALNGQGLAYELYSGSWKD